MLRTPQSLIYISFLGGRTDQDRNAPASLQITRGPGPIRQSNIHQNNQKETRKTSHITRWRPPSTFHSEVVRHRQRELLQLFLLESARAERISGRLPPTLPHEIFEMMPLDIVSQIANIDTAVLLGRFSERIHHLFFRRSAIFKGSGWRRTTTTSASVTRPRVSSRRVVCTSHRRSRPTFTAAIVLFAVAAARATAWGVGTTTTPWASRAAPWRARSLSL